MVSVFQCMRMFDACFDVCFNAQVDGDWDDEASSTRAAISDGLEPSFGSAIVPGSLAPRSAVWHAPGLRPLDGGDAAGANS